MTVKRRFASSSQATGWHPLTLSVIVTLWLVTVANLPLWQQLHQLADINGIRGFLFGCGMDYRGRWRHLDAIYAVTTAS